MPAFRRALARRLVAATAAIAVPLGTTAAFATPGAALPEGATPRTAEGTDQPQRTPVTGTDLVADFEDVTGWSQANLSDPLGTSTWGFGGSHMTAHQGTPHSYVSESFNATTDGGTISSWLISPVIADLTNGDTWSFWTQGLGSPKRFPERLEVRLSTDGNCNLDAGAAAVGSFTTLLLTVNPTLSQTGYPSTWKQYSGTISGLTEPASGCLGFRYHVPNSGPNGVNGYAIGIDTVNYTQVDLAPPNVSFADAPTGTVNTSTLSLSFTADEEATFECRLDNDAWASCTSPATFTDLTDGEHTIAIRGTDTVGNTGPEASTTFTVDVPAPPKVVKPTLKKIKLTTPKKVKAGKKFKATITGLVPGTTLTVRWAGKTKRITVPTTSKTTKVTVKLKAPKVKKTKKVKLTAKATAAGKKASATKKIKVRARR